MPAVSNDRRSAACRTSLFGHPGHDAFVRDPQEQHRHGGVFAHRLGGMRASASTRCPTGNCTTTWPRWPCWWWLGCATHAEFYVLRPRTASRCGRGAQPRRTRPRTMATPGRLAAAMMNRYAHLWRTRPRACRPGSRRQQDWVTVEQDRINLFADATMTTSGIHVDPARCQSAWHHRGARLSR